MGRDRRGNSLPSYNIKEVQVLIAGRKVEGFSQENPLSFKGEMNISRSIDFGISVMSDSYPHIHDLALSSDKVVMEYYHGDRLLLKAEGTLQFLGITKHLEDHPFQKFVLRVEKLFEISGG